ncbi:MAG TPA: hypothetical protein PLY42_05370 [Nitrospira sp.]|mgnify:FL=1|nr:hypothetical protein [Nitrospira sp.]MBX7038929.1 hypothetical protein [Nitrospira sp.]MCW5795322.1 hypothetical protein [Nitrospira sp.]HMU29644.1 hypothetical protein [Nitrospira sp.]HMV55928.1 hypothetical protein [Nitrospira sp.]
MRIPRSMQILAAGACLLLADTAAPVGASDQLVDVTGKVTPFVTLRSRDNFSSEYRYDVTVRNSSPDLFVADSLILVLDHITNTAGQDRENLTGESLLTRMEIIGQDGTTEDGKPYFRIPQGSGPDLTPNSESLPVTVRIRNRDYVAVFTPSFRVMGQRREPPKQKSQAAAAAAAAAPHKATTDKLIQLLLKKGLITAEEARTLLQP